MPHLAKAGLLASSLTLLLAAPTQAATLGSSLRSPADAGFGCESALRPNPFTGAPELQPTGHQTCTLRDTGPIGARTSRSIVPANGRVTGFRVRAGRNPAPLRLTILSGSFQPDPTGETSGAFSCCTARVFGKTFRPRANRITSQKVDIPVQNFSNGRRGFFDVVAISAMGPGTLPLHTEGVHFGFQPGAALTNFYYPYTRRGQPRPEANAVDGLEVLLRWDFKRGR